MWDYLRRTKGARGFFLPLSGGADSASVAAIVASMAKLVFEKSKTDPETLAELRRVVRDDKFTPSRYQDIVSRTFVTSYLGTVNSSEDTKSKADRIARDIGSYHLAVTIDDAYDQIVKILEKSTGKVPKYEARGGSYVEDLAL